MTGDDDYRKWPYTDARFRQLLQQKGWKKGDLWFPYEVTDASATGMWVQFLHRWWTVAVELHCSEGRWRPTTLHALDEGEDADLRWRVVEGGGGYRLVREN